VNVCAGNVKDDGWVCSRSGVVAWTQYERQGSGDGDMRGDDCPVWIASQLLRRLQ